MSIPSTTVWEVRTTGSSTNGGGFSSARSGTDYSQQDSSQLALTDGDCAGTTSLTSVTGGFTEAMEGNILYVVSGTGAQTGYYEIVDYISTNEVELDRAIGNSSEAGDIVFNVGGALDAPVRVANVGDTTAKMWIKKGTYTDYDGFFNCILHTTWIDEVEGYNATRGDKPTVEANMPKMDCDVTVGYGVLDQGAYTIIKNIVAINSTTSGFYNANAMLLENCISNSCWQGFNGNGYLKAINCLSYSNATDGFANIIMYAVGCVSHANGRDGFRGNGGDRSLFVSCISYNNTDNGFTTYGDSAGMMYAINCISYNNDVGYESSQEPTFFMNNIALDNTTYGFALVSASSDAVFLDYNCYHNNGTDLNNLTAGAHDITDDPLFTDPTGSPPDFSLQIGSPCFKTGCPRTLPGVTV